VINFGRLKSVRFDGWRVKEMNKFAYTTEIEDNTKFVYLSRLERNAKFGYNELSEIFALLFS